MTIYVITLLINISMGGLLFLGAKKTKRKEYIYLVFTFIQLSLLGGLRGLSVGKDTSAYHDIFYTVNGADTFKELFSIREEIGYVLLNKIIGLAGFGPQMVILVTSVIIAGGFLFFIKRNSNNILLSVILLICFMFFFTSFNVIRQYMATVIFINAYQFVKNRKVLPFMFLCLIAALFHKTVLLFLPLYFITFIKWDLIKVFSLLFILSIIAIFSSTLIDLSIKIFSQYTGYVGSLYFAPTSGMMMPIVFFSIFVFITFILLRFNPYKDKDFVLWYVICCMVVFLTVIAMTGASIANRLAWYLSPFFILLIPKALNYLPISAKTIMTITIFSVGTAYFLYCLSINWQSIMPYVPFWR